MRLVVTIVGGLIIVGLAAFGLVLAQKGVTPTATAASTVRIASATQEVSALSSNLAAKKRNYGQVSSIDRGHQQASASRSGRSTKRRAKCAEAPQDAADALWAN
jgi:hypothetical protein